MRLPSLFLAALAAGPVNVRRNPPRRTFAHSEDAVDEFSYDPKFMHMMNLVSGYTDGQLESIDNSRLRSLLRGIQVAAETEEVLQSFAILYEDFLPIRTAGSFLAKALDREVQHASHALTEVQAHVGATEEEVEAAAHLFRRLDMNGDGRITPEEWEGSGVLEVLPRMRSVEDIISTLSNGAVTYLEFLEGSQLLFGEDAKLGSRGGAGGLSALVEQLAARDSEVAEESFPPVTRVGQSKHGDRYDEMVETFREWENSQSQLEGKIKSLRLRKVIGGCFVGARSPPIVSALKTLYEDYHPLRIAGNLIFRLVKSCIFSSINDEREHGGATEGSVMEVKGR